MNDTSKEQIEELIKPDFATEISQFIKHIESQVDIVPLIMSLLKIKLLQESKHVGKYIDENGIIKGDEKNGQDEPSELKLLVPEDKIKGFIELSEKIETSMLAVDLLPINFIVSFVSQYDAYIGALIKTMFKAKPELLNSSERSVLFTELITFKSIEEATNFIIDKEVESVVRESHLKQFKWLENKLSIPLRKNLPSFSKFIEITERRNLFVHGNGVVSRQYIEICKENEVIDIEKIKIGEKLDAGGKYFINCYRVLFEIGVKLGQVMWRKLMPEEIEKADWHLNNVCYQLLLKGHYKLALNLLSFATETLKKHHNEEIACIFTINKSLAYYLNNKKEEAIKVLKGKDWSATSDKFKLATSILNEDYVTAYELMKTIGANDKNLGKNEYREWPLFKVLRKQLEFKSTYNEIFGEEFAYVEKAPRKFEDIIEEMRLAQLEEEKEKTVSQGVLRKSD